MARGSEISHLVKLSKEVPQVLPLFNKWHLRKPVEVRLNQQVEEWKDAVLTGSEATALDNLFKKSKIEAADLAGVAKGKYDAFRRRQRVKLAARELWHRGFAAGEGMLAGAAVVGLPVEAVFRTETADFVTSGINSLLDQLSRFNVDAQLPNLPEPVVFAIALAATATTVTSALLRRAIDKQTARIIHSSHRILIEQKDEAIKRLNATHTREGQPREWWDRQTTAFTSALNFLKLDLGRKKKK